MKAAPIETAITRQVSIAGAPARMTTATNFEGEVIVGVGTYTPSRSVLSAAPGASAPYGANEYGKHYRYLGNCHRAKPLNKRFTQLVSVFQIVEDQGKALVDRKPESQHQEQANPRPYPQPVLEFQ